MYDLKLDYAMSDLAVALAQLDSDGELACLTESFDRWNRVFEANNFKWDCRQRDAMRRPQRI